MIGPRHVGVYIFFALLFNAPGFAQDTDYPPQEEQIPGPDNALENVGQCCYNKDPQGKFLSKRDAWLADLKHWRQEQLIRMGYDGSQYARPELKWTQSSFIQPQMMIEDRYFYDPESGKYTVDKYLDDLEKRYGGIDSVLIWAVYPNIGIDNRNQYDMVRAMPGGIAGVKQMVADLHRRGVRVFFPFMLWDQGTRDEGAADWDAVAK